MELGPRRMAKRLGSLNSVGFLQQQACRSTEIDPQKIKTVPSTHDEGQDICPLLPFPLAKKIKVEGQQEVGPHIGNCLKAKDSTELPSDVEQASSAMATQSVASELMSPTRRPSSDPQDKSVRHTGTQGVHLGQSRLETTGVSSGNGTLALGDSLQVEAVVDSASPSEPGPLRVRKRAAIKCKVLRGMYSARFARDAVLGVLEDLGNLEDTAEAVHGTDGDAETPAESPGLEPRGHSRSEQEMVSSGTQPAAPRVGPPPHISQKNNCPGSGGDPLLASPHQPSVGLSDPLGLIDTLQTCTAGQTDASLGP